MGIDNLPFPMRVISKREPQGQHTVANISIRARIMQDFEARWIDKFIHIVHQHKERIGTSTLKVNILDYLRELNATYVKIDFDYPYFVEKTTPASKEKCLVSHDCTYSVSVSSAEPEPITHFGIRIPTITTYPASVPEIPGGLFGQLSIVMLEVETDADIYPEDLVEIVDRHALSPVYSFLTEEDQIFLIQKIHSDVKTSVVMVDEIKEELAHHRAVKRFSLRCANYGMLHSYSTVIATEKSRWVPFSGYEEEL